MSKRYEDPSEWANEHQQACYAMLCEWFGGEHHLRPERVKPCSPRGISYVHEGGLGSFDFGELTAGLFLAHDRCIRLYVAGAARGRLEITLHKRVGRVGDFSQRHPSIGEALENYCKSFPQPTEEVKP